LDWAVAALAGCAAGVLSGFGIGGGTLLLIYLALLAGVEQHAAQGINLAYFLTAAAAALYWHIRNGYVEKRAVLFAAGAGMLTTALSSWAAMQTDTHLLRKCFGLFLIYIALSMLFPRKKDKR
jgi:uncharacterized membrane protein YfcA